MATEHDTARFQYEMYRHCYDNGHSQWVQKAKRCFDFWNGDQWDALVKAKLESEGRPALTINIIESLVRSMVGIQRALSNDVRYMPVAGANAEQAKVQDAIWLHTQNQNQFDFVETDAWIKGLIMGRAYYEVRVDYDESLQGNTSLRGRRSQDIVLDPSIEHYDPAQWPRVFDRRWVSNTDIERLFGKAAAEEVGFADMPKFFDYEDSFMAQQMGKLPYYLHGATVSDPRDIRAHLLIGQQYRTMKMKEVFVDLQTGDMSEVPESWDRNRIARVLEVTPGLGTMRHKMNTVRWVVTCEQTVLHDEDSPYKWFTIVPFFPMFVDGITKGIVESMIDPQQLYNKITSQELAIINSTANSGWKVKSGTLKNMTIPQLEKFGSRPGMVAEVTEMDGLEKITPNSIPQGHDRLSFKADKIMRSISGVSEQGRGFAREDVAGEAILANQAAQDVNFAMCLGNLHRSKQLVAMRSLDCAQAHYTESRVLLINRGSAFQPSIDEVRLNEVTAEGAVINDVSQGKYTTALVPAPNRATLGEEDFKLLLMMREKLGIAIPDAMLIELSPAANKAQIIQMLGGDSNERQRAAEEAAAQEQQIKMQTEAARAEKERTAAALNQARAEKFAIEAATDPDAAYERVEQERIAVEREQFDAKLELDRLQLRQTKDYQDKQIALRLTELEQDRELAEVKARQDRQGPNRKSNAGSPAGK